MLIRVILLLLVGGLGYSLIRRSLPTVKAPPLSRLAGYGVGLLRRQLRHHPLLATVLLVAVVGLGLITAPPSDQALLAALTSTNESVRSTALVNGQHRLDDPRIRECYYHALQNENDAAILTVVCAAIARCDDDQAVAELIAPIITSLQDGFENGSAGWAAIALMGMPDVRYRLARYAKEDPRLTIEEPSEDVWCFRLAVDDPGSLPWQVVVRRLEGNWSASFQMRTPGPGSIPGMGVPIAPPTTRRMPRHDDF